MSVCRSLDDCFKATGPPLYMIMPFFPSVKSVDIKLVYLPNPRAHLLKTPVS